jgi:hypothetical protein
MVRFTTSVYRTWGLGVVLSEYSMKDRDPGFYYVLTVEGEKLVSYNFMEKICE